MKTKALFGVSPEVCRALKTTLSHLEYLEIGIVLMTRVQLKTYTAVQTSDYKYRAKAITNYEKWLKED